MEKNQHLEEANDRWLTNVNSIQQSIKSGESPRNLMTFITMAKEVHAVKSFYLDRDIDKTKLSFYQSARCAEYAIQKFDPRIIESGVEYISIALLSDSSFLIQQYSLITAKYPLCIGFQIVNAMQNILNGKLEELPENIRQIKRLCSTKTFKNLTPFVPVFEAFLNKDKSALEEGLLELLATHKKRTTDPLIPRFLSVDTAGLCKLAWIKGYEIDLKSDLVPVELMPIKPLERYEDDDVLKMLLNVN